MLISVFLSFSCGLIVEDSPPKDLSFRATKSTHTLESGKTGALTVSVRNSKSVRNSESASHMQGGLWAYDDDSDYALLMLSVFIVFAGVEEYDMKCFGSQCFILIQGDVLFLYTVW